MEPPALSPSELLLRWQEERRRGAIPCIAYTAAGAIYGAPATQMDRQRGGMVCAAPPPLGPEATPEQPTGAVARDPRPTETLQLPETAFERERQLRQPVLFPIRLDDTVLDIAKGWAADIRRSRHIRKEVGQTIGIGACNNAPCYSIPLDRLDGKEVIFKIGGAGFSINTIGAQSPPGSPVAPVHIPLRTGCKRTVLGKDLALLIAIENDSYTKLRTGIGIKTATKDSPGLSILAIDCPKE